MLSGCVGCFPARLRGFFGPGSAFGGLFLGFGVAWWPLSGPFLAAFLVFPPVLVVLLGRFLALLPFFEVSGPLGPFFGWHGPSGAMLTPFLGES